MLFSARVLEMGRKQQLNWAWGSRVKCPGIHSNWRTRLSVTAWRIWSSTEDMDSEDLFQMKLNQLVKGILHISTDTENQNSCPDPFTFLSPFTWKSFAATQIHLQLNCNIRAAFVFWVVFFSNRGREGKFVYKSFYKVLAYLLTLHLK